LRVERVDSDWRRVVREVEWRDLSWEKERRKKNGSEKG